MKPVMVAPSLGSDATQTMRFSYSAKVPPSPAYDSSTVTSPDPMTLPLPPR